MYVVVIDAHLHLWNTERLRYEWLQRPENAAINRAFGFGDFISRATTAGVDRAVLVQADDSAARSVHRDGTGVCVGWLEVSPGPCLRRPRTVRGLAGASCGTNCHRGAGGPPPGCSLYPSPL